MKILHVLDHSIPLQSGYTFRTRAILREQRARGWETVHLTGSKHPADGGLSEEVDGLLFHRTPAPRSRLSTLPGGAPLAVIRALRKRLDALVARERPDVLHAHSPALNGLAALQSARAHGLPLVYEVRAFWEDAAVDHGTSTAWGPRYRLSRALETYVLRRAHAVTTICEGLRGEMRQRGIPPQRISVIPNAVDVERFVCEAPPEPELARELGLEGRKVIGFVGSFYGYEGLSLLLQALPGLLRRHPEVAVLLVGGGPQDAALRQAVRELGLGERVRFTGRVPHAEVQRYYRLIDILAYPRLPMRLTELVTPLKPLEAMAQKQIFVASDVGGHRELVRHGETGMLFRAGDPEALGTCLSELLATPALWPRLRENGRHFVEAERTWRDSVARYEQVYTQALQRVGKTTPATRGAPTHTGTTTGEHGIR